MGNLVWVPAKKAQGPMWQLCSSDNDNGKDHDNDSENHSDNDQDNDNDTLIEDGSNKCQIFGPAGMSDGVMTPRKSIGNLDTC